MKPIALFFVTLATVASMSIAGAAMAGTEVNTSRGLTVSGPGLAVHGYDVVAYFTQNEPVRGRAKYSVVHDDATYRFANEEHFKAFKADPQRYVPQYGGYCAYGVAVGGKFDGDPHLWRIVDGKLYLNLNEEIQETWEDDIPGYIEKAGRIWARIADKTPEELS